MASSKNLTRLLSVNVVRLAAAVLKEFSRSGFDLDRIVAGLRNQIWGADLSDEEKRALLFGNQAWDQLQMAVLEARHMHLPDSHIPASEAELSNLCTWLMSRDADDDGSLRAVFVAGWAAKERPEAAFSTFIGQLCAICETDIAFFNAVVSGRHGLALEIIVERRLSARLDEALAVRLLTQMALIWAAFDCQCTTARVRRSMTRPFGWLVTGEAAQIRAATLISLFRPLAVGLSKIRTSYRHADQPVPRRASIRMDAVMDIRAKAESSAEEIECARGPHAHDGLMAEIARRDAQPTQPFLQQVHQSSSDAGFGVRQMSQVWYADLLPVQAVGLPVLRLVQMEQMLETLLVKEIALARQGGRKARFTVPDFSAKKLSVGWKGRARAVVDALRASVLRDPDHHSVRTANASRTGEVVPWVGAANDDRFIDALLDFLAATRRFPSGVGGMAWSRRRNAFCDLDLALQRRFELNAILSTDGSITQQSFR